MTEIWGAIIVFVVSPIIGAIPLVDWFTYAVSGKELKKLGNGNISVSAAFYHGGRAAGILAFLSEAGKGVAVVLMTRAFFPLGSSWEIMALIALVMGRYWVGKGAGLTNVTWGIIAHNPLAGLLILLLGGISFTIFRTRKGGQVGFLGLMVVVLSVQNINSPEYIFVTIGLAGLLWWIFDQISDEGEFKSSQVFSFFRGDSGVTSLSQKLNNEKVGDKAANLSLLKQWGYSVPDGWVIKAGDDLDTFCDFANPSIQNPLVVRPSVLDKDSLTVSAAGIYESYLDITDGATLKHRIIDCLSSYHSAIALNYRQNKGTKEKSLMVIVQKQIRGEFSGVAFSRNPINQLDDCICIEGVAGDTSKVVSGQVSPEKYQVYLADDVLKGRGNIPPSVLFSVAKIAREIERTHKNIPQDIEWSYDGQTLWILQNRPISTLYPLWTRKIAQEIFPKPLPHLSWGVHNILISAVARDIVSIILQDKGKDLEFNKIAILHYSYGYFNATLLGEIFLLIGLPPESLQYLTDGEKFAKPSLSSILKNIPTLWRLLVKEWTLFKDFQVKGDRTFNPLLDELEEINPNQLSNQELLQRIDNILEGLKTATYFKTLAYLSYIIRQTLFKVNAQDLDNQNITEIRAIEELKQIAIDTRNLFSGIQLQELEPQNYPSFFATLSESSDGESVIKRLNEWLEKYGYLSEITTDISVPRWSENHRIMKIMFTKFVADNSIKAITNNKLKTQNIQQKIVQKRYELKGEIVDINNKLFSHLRSTFIALGEKLSQDQILLDEKDIFFLKIPEIKQLVNQKTDHQHIISIINKRQQKCQEYKEIKKIPYLIYGKSPKINIDSKISPKTTQNQLQGIPASMGIIEGKIKIIRTLTQNINIDKETIIIVPYIDASWSLILAQAGGIITEIGGQLSHGAIIAREYSIPAVMNIPQASRILRNNQKVRLDGQKGIVEIL
ncbi:glycerol-3-phosphate acyltransferase [Cyanobacterium sp. IPPAS B-1200]|uniref:glycerol-3-phosphate acyltransferase n=1 Tax=Cyanobacterium sp. IPPAS B-1200 TaxID=1562720 RepID=UPI0008526965|nr:glycerol-3-phosphate acyltransferase [Cyanobacterium sp. IPPAS B-1200]OEJ78572.1 pyruvate phosphate dikinase PEP/pyruvate-binding protein [Cyanobacterium sp. IPPAS B-1200]